MSRKLRDDFNILSPRYFNNVTHNMEHKNGDIINLVGEPFLIVLLAAGSLWFFLLSFNHGFRIWADSSGDNQWLSPAPGNPPPHDVSGQPTECKQYTLCILLRVSMCLQNHMVLLSILSDAFRAKERNHCEEYIDTSILLWYGSRNCTLSCQLPGQISLWRQNTSWRYRHSYGVYVLCSNHYGG